MENVENKNSIKTLYLSNQGLSELPDLSEYKNLQYLYCSNNNISEISIIPDTVEFLFCSKNKLSKLPKLPKSLKKLSCDYNDLPYTNLEEYNKWQSKFSIKYL